MLTFPRQKDSAKCIFLVPDLEKMGLTFHKSKIQDQRKKNFKIYVPESLTNKK